MQNNLQSVNKSLEIDTFLANQIGKHYLANGEYEILPREKNVPAINLQSTIRFLHVTKFVFEKEEKIIDKFISIYSSLHSLGSSIIVKLISDGKQCNIYFGIKKEGDAAISLKVLRGALEGNFPGTTFENEIGLSTSEIDELRKVSLAEVKEISTVIGVPSLKDKEGENFIQGLENLIKGMQGKPFSALFIANPISTEENEKAKSYFEEIYSNLTPLKEQTLNFGENDSHSFTDGINKTIGTTIGSSFSDSKSLAETNSTNTTKNPWIGKSIRNKIKGFESKSNNVGTTDTTSKTSTANESESRNFGTNKSNTNSTGTSSSVQFIKENKKITNILENLDLKFERLKKGENVGLWNVGVYFFSKEMQNSIVAASIYNGIIKGEDSRVERSVIKTFKGDKEITEVSEYFKNYEIPEITINNSEYANTLGTIVSSDELTVQMCLPHKSIIGLDVVEVAAFGNNLKINKDTKAINIGKLYNYEKQYEVDFGIEVDKLTGHLFVTGSTGSGKSNVTYQILNELIKKDIKFMVIEPAKGEYKDVFGNKKNVTVYSTNPNISRLLKINPFSFPNGIHIYEHIDRFIEILNACWTMEAAMPAFLKEAVELTYQKKGWDLITSKNLLDENCFPTFYDLLVVLPVLIQESSFSQEIKNNYTGALVTRVKSMTNGLLRPVFCSNEIIPGKLFDENSIIDLSKVASSETKSLLMGIMFMKLQEHRIANRNGNNSNLKHVTIIEEAHNLLKRTSTEQSQSNANLQGKSVEMMSNAIAEMRTYGEGFILADQAPGLLDPSAIRNTNTKICLRLPSQDDRELVGKAMNLDDLQINELAKLKTGVGAVYQNDWQEAMLCKFSYFENKENNFKYSSQESLNLKAKLFLGKQLVAKRNGEALDETRLRNIAKHSDFKNLAEKISGKDLSEDEIAKMLYQLFEIEMIVKIVDSNCDPVNTSEWLKMFSKVLENKWGKLDGIRLLDVKNLILKHLAILNEKKYKKIYFLNNKYSKLVIAN